MVASFTRLVSLCGLASIPVLFAAQNPAPRETVLNHVSVIDMTGRPIQRDMAVLFRGDRIAAIDRAAGLNVPGARVMDLTGKFLIPGLVDMHNHLDTGASMPGPPIPGQARCRDVRANLKQMLGWGFTTVFSTSHSNVDLREFAELRRAALDDTALPGISGSAAPSPSPQVMRHNHVSLATCLGRQTKHARMSGTCMRSAWTRSS